MASRQNIIEATAVGVLDVTRSSNGSLVLGTGIINRGDTTLGVFASTWKRMAMATLRGQKRPESVAAAFAPGFVVPATIAKHYSFGGVVESREAINTKVAGWAQQRKDLATFHRTEKLAAAFLRSIGR